MQNFVVLGFHSILSSKKRILSDHGQNIVHRFNSCVLYFSRRLREAVKLSVQELGEKYLNTKRCERLREGRSARETVARVKRSDKKALRDQSPRALAFLKIMLRQKQSGLCVPRYMCVCVCARGRTYVVLCEGPVCVR